MFHRFSAAARSLVFRARDIAKASARSVIEPDDILLALIELQPGLLEKLSEHSIDLQSFRNELAESRTSSPLGRNDKLRFGEACKRVLKAATQEAQLCWERWEAPRRRGREVLPEDLSYWEARLKQPLDRKKTPGWLASRALRRKWEVDEHHLLLGLLKETEYPGAAILRKRNLALETARHRLCSRSNLEVSRTREPV
jgi:ATP-dependent Clp protease ATP-binding subunit ClpA